MAGRIPIPAQMIDEKKHKKSKEEIESRKLIESAITVKATLKVPSHLSEEAKKEWRRIMKLYKSMTVKILCDLDITALAMYCEAVAIYKSAQADWVTIQFENSDRDEMGNPLSVFGYLPSVLRVMKEQNRIVNNLAEQLCLTPVGRARLGVMKKAAEEETDDLSELGF